jgi:hypothetical protein
MKYTIFINEFSFVYFRLSSFDRVVEVLATLKSRINHKSQNYTGHENSSTGFAFTAAMPQSNTLPTARVKLSTLSTYIVDFNYFTKRQITQVSQNTNFANSAFTTITSLYNHSI